LKLINYARESRFDESIPTPIQFSLDPDGGNVPKTIGLRFPPIPCGVDGALARRGDPRATALEIPNAGLGIIVDRDLLRPPRHRRPRHERFELD